MVMIVIAISSGVKSLIGVIALNPRKENPKNIEYNITPTIIKAFIVNNIIR